jgi:hypothetical protein
MHQYDIKKLNVRALIQICRGIAHFNNRAGGGLCVGCAWNPSLSGEN